MLILKVPKNMASQLSVQGSGTARYSEYTGHSEDIVGCYNVYLCIPSVNNKKVALEIENTR